MDIQWPLVLFTVLNGIGGWLIAAVALNEFTRKSTNAKTRTVALVCGMVLVIVAGICSAFHLSHPERMMNALSHPTSGIFTEALLTGLLVLFVIIFLVLIKRGANEKTLRVLAVITGALGVILPVATGCSYLMPGRPGWDTPLFPLACAATTGLTGFATYAIILTRDASDEAALAYNNRITFWFAVAAFVTTIIWAASNGSAIGTYAVLFWVGVVAVGGVVPAVCTYLSQKKEQARSLVYTTLVTSVIGSFAFRCFMWLMGAGVLDLIGNGNWFGQI